MRTTPFSLVWSEGNRFYDYSLIFGKKLYDYTGNLTVPYNSPGRYALWGSLFLIPGLPIWAHRLWDALLWVGTPLALTVVLAWNIKKPLLRWGMILWGALFIMQGPVYPHLLVPMILLALFMRSDKLWVKLIAGAVFSYYAGISRFTWAVLPGVWLVLQDLIVEYPKREGSWIRRLTPPTLLGLAGILPGLISTWAGNANPIQGLDISTAAALIPPLSQFHLWRRDPFRHCKNLSPACDLTDLVHYHGEMEGQSTGKGGNAGIAGQVSLFSAWLPAPRSAVDPTFTTLICSF